MFPASSATPSQRPIALVGMMGAGKTEVGRLLAERLGRPFHDSDGEVERAAGCTIAQLFAREGEADFRVREREAVAALLGHGAIVLATGGGAMADPGTRALLLEQAETIWLDAQPAILARRLAGTSGRPLIDGDDPESALTRLLAERRSCYAQAAHHVRTDDKGLDEVAEALLKLLGR
jgi:shikimate kinase